MQFHSLKRERENQHNAKRRWLANMSKCREVVQKLVWNVNFSVSDEENKSYVLFPQRN